MSVALSSWDGRTPTNDTLGQRAPRPRSPAPPHRYVHALRRLRGVCRARRPVARRLEALAVHDRGAALVVLLLGDPHLLEGGERREDGAADPHAVLALGRRDDLDLHGAGASAVISLDMRSAMPAYMVVPPESTTL